MRAEAVAIEHYFGASHIGHVRAENQDVWRAIEEMWAFLIADGMGGRKAGRVAAQIAVAEMAKSLLGQSEVHHVEEGVAVMRRAMLQANQSVFEGSHTKEREGMGTTLAALWFVADRAICAHVGDSRIYCVRDAGLRCLTQDHTLFYERYARGDEASKHILSRAIGITPSLEPTIQVIVDQPGDLFLLCTDGLTNALTEKEIARILVEDRTLDAKAQLLVQAALNLGGRDNITVLLVRRGR